MNAGNRLQLILKKHKRVAIGLMSGTSADGIDAVLVQLSGHGTSTKIKELHFITHPIPARIRKRLLAISLPGCGTTADVCELNFIMARLFGKAVSELLSATGITAGEVDFIGSHGQTIHHLPAKRTFAGVNTSSTLQIGDPSVIAKLTGITTIGNFRAGDIALGGEGAPLVPYFDYINAVSKHTHRLLLNIGGIGNITALPRNCNIEEVTAFDTGPGNMLIDGAMLQFYGKRLDRDGMTALRGKLNTPLLNYLRAADAFISRKPPKSTGREQYGRDYLQNVMNRHPDALPEDIIATLTYFTAYAVHANYLKFLSGRIPVGELIVSGGGARNKAIMAYLGSLFGAAFKVMPYTTTGYSSDAKEAVCFAVLANETLSGSPANLPAVTGAQSSTILGSICLP